MSSKIPVAVVWLLLLTLTTARAQPAMQTSDDVDDAESVRQAIASYEKAFQARDAEQLASHWSVNGVYIDPESGERIDGRNSIKLEFERLFSQDDVPQLALSTESIQMVSPNVAVERGTATVTSANAEVTQSRYSVVYVKQDGKWLIDRVSENPSEIRPSSYERLKDLEWMIGDWTMQGEGFSVELSAQWTANQNFICRKFKVSNDSEVESTGLQLIGWDARENDIRSWLFDSDGTFVKGRWNRKDDGWSVVSTASLIDGTVGSFTSIIRMVDGDSYGWQKINRVLDGEMLPNIEELIVTRN